METITIQPIGIGDDAGTSPILTIDSVQYTLSTLPSSFSWPAGSTHTITASSVVAAGTGKQYVWASWSDGGAQTHTYTVPTSSATITVDYNTQYYLTVSSAYGSPTGQGWYNAGSTANFGIGTPVAGGSGTQYAFASWTGSGTGSYSGTNNPCSVVMNNPITEIAGQNTQYRVTFNYQVSGGGSGYSAPSANYISNGQQLYVTASSTATVWVDSGTTYTYSTNMLVGSGGSERWQTGSNAPTGTITSPVTINPIYYNQYLMTLSYSVSDGGSGYSAPTFTANQLGFPYGQVLTTAATGYWFDAGSSWSVSPNPLTGSSSTERWQTNQALSGTISSYQTLAFTYYNQYKHTLSYTVVDGGSPSAPTATGTSLGVAYVPSLTKTATGYWFDASGSITFSTSTSGSTEQWVPSPSSVSATSSNTQVVSMYNQYQVTFDASSNVKSDSSATIVTVAGIGYNYAQLPYTGWFNAASLTYSYASPIGSSSVSTAGYYWSSTSGLSQTLQSNTFTVSGSGTITATYTAQTFGIDTSCEGFGSVSSGKTITTSSMTAQANELVIILITGNSSSPTVSSVTDSFGTHLTYHQQVAYSSSSAGQCLYVYYAVTGSQTGSFTVTVTMSSNYNYCVQAFGITGANTATPFDTNGNLPAKNVGTSSSLPTVTGVSTSNANDMILAFEGQTSSTTQTAGSSFTAPAGLLHNANSLGNNVEYQIVSATQSSVSVSFGTSVTPWIMAVDGVQRAW